MKKDELLLDIILHGFDKYKDSFSKEILLHTIGFAKNSKRATICHQFTFAFIFIIFFLGNLI